MENIITSRISKYKQAVKHWWLILVLGLAILLIGILIFGYPGESYLSMSLIFGILILISGIIHIVLSLSGDWTSGKWWLLIGGIIELLLGVVLSLYPIVSATTLPVFLGFWLLFRAFSMLGMASDMRSAKIVGSGWTIFTSILLLLCSFAILLHPVIFGVSAVVIWVGASFVIAGISTISLALQLHKVHKHLNK